MGNKKKKNGHGGTLRSEILLCFSFFHRFPHNRGSAIFFIPFLSPINLCSNLKINTSDCVFFSFTLLEPYPYLVLFLCSCRCNNFEQRLVLYPKLIADIFNFWHSNFF